MGVANYGMEEISGSSDKGMDGGFFNLNSQNVEGNEGKE